MKTSLREKPIKRSDDLNIKSAPFTQSRITFHLQVQRIIFIACSVFARIVSSESKCVFLLSHYVVWVLNVDFHLYIFLSLLNCFEYFGSICTLRTFPETEKGFKVTNYYSIRFILEFDFLTRDIFKNETVTTFIFLRFQSSQPIWHRLVNWRFFFSANIIRLKIRLKVSRNSIFLSRRYSQRSTCYLNLTSSYTNANLTLKKSQTIFCDVFYMMSSLSQTEFPQPSV